MSVLQYILSLYGPRGEQRGKALSGADFVCAVANPSTPTKKQSERVAFFVLYLPYLLQNHHQNLTADLLFTLNFCIFVNTIKQIYTSEEIFPNINLWS